MEFTCGKYLLQMQEMTMDDLPDVLEIENVCHSHPWKESHFVSSINSSHQCKILKDESHLVGYVITSTAADEAELLNITIAQPYQNKGLGKHLLSYICRCFDATIQTLFLEVRESNQVAIKLYHSLDFNEVGKRSNYYPSAKSSQQNREDAIIMAKVL